MVSLPRSIVSSQFSHSGKSWSARMYEDGGTTRSYTGPALGIRWFKRLADLLHDADMNPPFLPACLVRGRLGHAFLPPQRKPSPLARCLLPREILDRQNFRIFWSIPLNLRLTAVLTLTSCFIYQSTRLSTHERWKQKNLVR